MGSAGQDGQEKAAGCAGGATPRDIALVRAALEAAAEMFDSDESGLSRNIAAMIRAVVEDAAAIAASVEVEADDEYPEEPISVVPRPSTRVTLVPKALLDERDAELADLRARVAELQLQLAIAEEALARKPVRGD